MATVPTIRVTAIHERDTKRYSVYSLPVGYVVQDALYVSSDALRQAFSGEVPERLHITITKDA